jgi:hypothetical protein
MMRHSFTVLLLPCVLISCAQPAQTSLPDGAYVRGNARVVSIDPDSGHAVLDFQGRQVDAYWQTEVYLAQGGTLVQNDPLKPPVGQYAAPITKPQTLNAKAGDTISFIGMATPSGILLRSVAVNASAKP